MALRSIVRVKDLKNKVADRASVSQLYRAIIKEIPRVLAIYDIDMPVKTAKAAVAYHFKKNHYVHDGRLVSILLAKGYMELEETLLQWKQKTHLMRILEPIELEMQARPLTKEEENNRYDYQYE